jgi:hypothetical protein
MKRLGFENEDEDEDEKRRFKVKFRPCRRPRPRY